MKVKDVLNHYGMASNGKLFVEVNLKKTEVSKNALDNNPFLDMTVGQIRVIDNNLIISATESKRRVRFSASGTQE